MYRLLRHHQWTRSIPIHTIFVSTLNPFYFSASSPAQSLFIHLTFIHAPLDTPMFTSALYAPSHSSFVNTYYSQIIHLCPVHFRLSHLLSSILQSSSSVHLFALSLPTSSTTPSTTAFVNLLFFHNLCTILPTRFYQSSPESIFSPRIYASYPSRLRVKERVTTAVTSYIHVTLIHSLFQPLHFLCVPHYCLSVIQLWSELLAPPPPPPPSFFR